MKPADRNDEAQTCTGHRYAAAELVCSEGVSMGHICSILIDVACHSLRRFPSLSPPSTVNHKETQSSSEDDRAARDTAAIMGDPMLWSVNRLWTAIESIDSIVASSTSVSIHEREPIIRCHVCEAVILTCKMVMFGYGRPTMYPGLFDFPKKTKKTEMSKSEMLLSRRQESSLNPVHEQEDRVRRRIREGFVGFAPCVSSELESTLVCVFRYCREKDSVACSHELHKVLCRLPTDEEGDGGEGGEKGKVAPVSDVGAVKGMNVRQRTDVVWYPWRLTNNHILQPVDRGQGVM